MAKRTDLAAPTIIDPAAFTFVAGVYFGSKPGEDFDSYLGEWLLEKDQHDPEQKAGWYSKKPKVLADFPPLNAQGNFARKGTCDHCGARFDWGAVYQHTSGLHIVVGNVCADKTMDVPTRVELDTKRLKARIAALREAERNAAAARAQAAAQGFEWLFASTEHGNHTLDDIARKGLAWGGLTVGQIALVKKLHDGTPAEWEVKKAAREAARAAEEAAALPVPATEERIAIEGEVLSTKEKEGYMPGMVAFKMLVKTAAGYKLWGSIPAVLLAEGPHEELRGKRVAFSAKVERSRDDEKFGFFSRPTKVRIVPTAATVVTPDQSPRGCEIPDDSAASLTVPTSASLR